MNGKLVLRPFLTCIILMLVSGVTLFLFSQAALAAKPTENYCAFVRGVKCGVSAAKKRGMVPTRLRPVFPKGAVCPRIDEKWAIDYTNKRAGHAALHGGIDMPAPFGTPIVAAAAGTVVLVINDPLAGFRGREVVLQHSTHQSGLPVVVYTQYAHFDQPLRLKRGQHIKRGQVLGLTGNSGRGSDPGVQSKRRRPAIHFGVFYARGSHFKTAGGRIIVPKDGRWADPVSLYRNTMPLDTRALGALPRAQKRVGVAVKYYDGSVSDPAAPFIWPYMCARHS